MATYMVANGRNAGNYGYGNAVAVVLFLISLVVALMQARSPRPVRTFTIGFGEAEWDESAHAAGAIAAIADAAGAVVDALLVTGGFCCIYVLFT